MSTSGRFAAKYDPKSGVRFFAPLRVERRRTANAQKPSPGVSATPAAVLSSAALLVLGRDGVVRTPLGYSTWVTATGRSSGVRNVPGVIRESRESVEGA